MGATAAKALARTRGLPLHTAPSLLARAAGVAGRAESLVLAVSDALLLANIADGVVLVVQSRRSREDQAHAAIMRLQQVGAVILGAVLNRGEVDHEYYHYAYAKPAPAEVTIEEADGVIVDDDTRGSSAAGQV